MTATALVHICSTPWPTPYHQGTGIGRELVYRVIEECRASLVEWLHVDIEIGLNPFCLTEGLFRPTTVGILTV